MNSYDYMISQLISRRKNLKLSQNDLDFKIGCSDGLVHKWERGKRKPSGFMFACWVEALDCELQIKQR